MSEYREKEIMYLRCKTDDYAAPKTFQFPVKTQCQTKGNRQRNDIVSDEVCRATNGLLANTSEQTVGTGISLASFEESVAHMATVLATNAW